MEPLRVGVVEEDEIFRRGIVAVLEEEFVCLVVEADREALPETVDKAGRLDVAVVCSRMLDWVQLACPIVCLAFVDLQGRQTCHASPHVKATLPHQGLTAEELIASVRAAAAGLQVEASSLSPRAEPILDPRRIEVLKLLAVGGDTRAIAQKLELSERTVKALVHDIELSLGASTRAQAVAEGVRLGLI
jgi:DNA-binding NarL/FixJ family response regulator